MFTIILNDRNEILLMRRQHTGFGDGGYSLPGGHVEKGERILDAARRETSEEVGIHIHNAEVVGVVHSDVDREYLHFSVASGPGEWSGQPQNREPDQRDLIGWFPITDYPDRTLPCIRLAIENYRTGTPFTE